MYSSYWLFTYPFGVGYCFIHSSGNAKTRVWDKAISSHTFFVLSAFIWELESIKCFIIMGTVTIHNYCFPIIFSYKGWQVTITDETGLFSLQDLKVRVKMVVDSDAISINIARAAAETARYRQVNTYGFRSINSMQSEHDVYQKEYNRISILANEFARNKGTINYSLAMNGGMLDRFFGQNISATKKMCQKVIDNIDRTYGDMQNEFLRTLK